MSVPDGLGEAWLLAAVLIAGLAAGNLGLLLLGRLLGREWLTPLEDEMLPGAWTMPVAAALAAPLLLLLGAEGIAGRAAGYFLLWTLIAGAAARYRGRLASAAGLALLLPTASLAAMDLLAALGPGWLPGLFGFAFAVSQLAPALALALIVNALECDHVSRTTDRSLTSALLTLTLAAAGLWFVQFLAAWMADLPREAAWYQARLAGSGWVPLALAAAAAGAAVLLLVQRHRGAWTVLAAAALVALQHPIHVFWLLRPSGTPTPGPIDAAALLGIGGLWLLAWIALMRRHDARRAQSGRPGSS